MDTSQIAILLVLALAFANGTNDVSKAIATLVGSGMTNYQRAMFWGSAWTIAGAALSAIIATAMVHTFSTGLVRPETHISGPVAVSVILGATLWVLTASLTGLPVSTTHALLGAIVGAGITALGHGALIGPAIIQKIVLPLLLSPVLALLVSLLIHPLIRLLAERWQGSCLCFIPTHRAVIALDSKGMTRTLFQAAGVHGSVTGVPAQCERAGLKGLMLGLDTIHWLSSGLASLARGVNDTPKIVALAVLSSDVVTLNSPSTHFLLFFGIAAAMGLGSLVGLRVTEVLAEKVTTMDHAEGLSANLTTSSLVLISAVLGLPVSTTHVSSSAIIGIGLLKGVQAVRWTTVRDIVLAWVITLPASGVLAGLAYILLSLHQ